MSLRWHNTCAGQQSAQQAWEETRQAFQHDSRHVLCCLFTALPTGHMLQHVLPGTAAYFRPRQGWHGLAPASSLAVPGLHCPALSPCGSMPGPSTANTPWMYLYTRYTLAKEHSSVQGRFLLYSGVWVHGFVRWHMARGTRVSAPK